MMSRTRPHDDRKGHHYYTRIGRRFARLNCDALRARPYIVVMTLAVIMRLGAAHHAAWCRSSCGLVPLIMRLGAAHYAQFSGCCSGPRCKGILGTAQGGGQGWEMTQKDCSHGVLVDPVEAGLGVDGGCVVGCEETITI